MAKESMFVKQRHCLKSIDRYSSKRAALRSQIKAVGDYEQVEKAVIALQKLPLICRQLVRRCQQCGQPKGVYRIRLCRICLRQP